MRSPCPLGLRDAGCPCGCRDAGGGLSISPSPHPQARDRGQGGPWWTPALPRASPPGSRPSVQFLGPAPKGHAQRCRLLDSGAPRLPSQGPAQSPLETLPQPTAPALTQTERNRSRGAQKPGSRKGLDEPHLGQESPRWGSPDAQRGLSYPFKIGVQLLCNVLVSSVQQNQLCECAHKCPTL